jgi:hypothetical protein
MPIARAGHEEWRFVEILLPETKNFRDMGAVLDGGYLAEQAVVSVDNPLLIERRTPGLVIKCSRNEVPHLLLQRHFSLQVVDLVASPDPEFETAGPIYAETIPDIPAIVPATENALTLSNVGASRPNERMQC